MTTTSLILISVASFVVSFGLGELIERAIKKRKEKKNSIGNDPQGPSHEPLFATMPKSSRKKFKIGRITNLADPENEQLMALLVSQKIEWITVTASNQSLVGKYIQNELGNQVLVMSDTIGLSPDGTKIGHWLSVVDGFAEGVDEIFVECKVPVEVGQVPPKAFIENVEYFCKNQCPMDCEGCKLSVYGLRKTKRSKKS